MAPALPSTPRKGTQTGFDVVIGEVTEPVLAQVIATCLVKKGFCVIDLKAERALCKQFVSEANGLKESGRWHQPPELIAEGLLGQEGSAKVCELTGADVPESVRTEQGPCIVAIDNLLTSITQMVNNCNDILGFHSSHRTPGMLHEAGVPRSPPELKEKDVPKWLDIFLRARVMAVAFFGPMEGALKLQVYDDEDADVHEVRTSPGTLVVLRPDILSHHHIALGKAIAISCCAIQGATFSKRHNTGGWVMNPVARELDRWAMNRVMEMKAALAEDEEFRLEEDIPHEFQRAMDLCFFQESVNSVRGMAMRFPGSWDPGEWFRSTTAGPDFVTCIPLVRWDHDQVFDTSIDGWKKGKTYARHAAFFDGLELFDARMFSISPMEAKSMDPNQRLTLETCYESLYNMGMRKKSLMNSSGSCYVGFNAVGDYNLADRGGADMSGPTGGAGCIISNRMSYVFGMKGPSLTVNTMAASSLTAVYLGVESMQHKGRGVNSDFSVMTGVCSLLHAHWWPMETGNGWLSFKGRCFTFDAHADGYTKSEGCASVAMSPYANKEVDGKAVVDSSLPQEGVLHGIAMNTNSLSANLSAPDGVALQEVVAAAVRSAGLVAHDVDAVEASATGFILGDCVEAHSHVRAHRAKKMNYPLAISSLSTSIGHMTETSGIAAFIKAVQAPQWAYIAPSLHFREVNPNIDFDDANAILTSEGIDYPRRSSLTGVTSRGFGGTNVYAVLWGCLDDKKVKIRPPMPSNRELLTYWPGGGGALSREDMPSKGYYVAGTWTQWSKPQRMDFEGDDVYGLTVTLGENNWEMFQIWIDGDPMKILHPGTMSAGKEAPVQGPHPFTPCCWGFVGALPEIIVQVQVEDQNVEGDFKELMPALNLPLPPAYNKGKTDFAKAPHPDSGRPGTKYRIRLHQAGRWRMVDWAKVPDQEELADGALLPEEAIGRYYVCGSWNSYCTQEMETDEAAHLGVWKREVKLTTDGGEFFVNRNRDSLQAIYPSSARAAQGKVPGPGGISGPGHWESGLAWQLEGKAGDVFRIEFRRSQELGKQEDMAVTWTHVRHEPLTDAEQLQALRPCWTVLGSWSSWRDTQPMIWEEDRNLYSFQLQIGDVGRERFQLMRDGHPQMAIYPSEEDACQQKPHELLGPDAGNNGLFWAIGAHPEDKAWPGMRYEIRLHVDLRGRPDKVDWSRI
eukprot:gb/GFBE01015293.1/.p1 GENE.gb/GFBE01015293.1/~~gb/GFBE01015293.1/.p1  ORF type:complete len:1187 (+),score=233.74 gb/GFBE01015293.1/:1-3561(+)